MNKYFFLKLMLSVATSSLVAQIPATSTPSVPPASSAPPAAHAPAPEPAATPESTIDTSASNPDVSQTYTAPKGLSDDQQDVWSHLTDQQKKQVQEQIANGVQPGDAVDQISSSEEQQGNDTDPDSADRPTNEDYDQAANEDTGYSDDGNAGTKQEDEESDDPANNGPSGVPAGNDPS